MVRRSGEQRIPQTSQRVNARRARASSSRAETIQKGISPGDTSSSGGVRSLRAASAGAGSGRSLLSRHGNAAAGQDDDCRGAPGPRPVRGKVRHGRGYWQSRRCAGAVNGLGMEHGSTQRRRRSKLHETPDPGHGSVEHRSAMDTQRSAPSPPYARRAEPASPKHARALRVARLMPPPRRSAPRDGSGPHQRGRDTGGFQRTRGDEQGNPVGWINLAPASRRDSMV